MELRVRSLLCMAIPGADCLAIIASEDPAMERIPDVRGKLSPVFDGPVADTAVTVEDSGSREGLSGAGFEATGTLATVIRMRGISRGLQRGQDDAQKGPGTEVFIDEKGIFPGPAQTCLLRPITFQNRSGVHLIPVLCSRESFLDPTGGTLKCLSHDLVIISPPRITGDLS